MWEFCSISEETTVVLFQFFFQEHNELILTLVAEYPAQQGTADIRAEGIMVLVVVLNEEPCVFHQTEISVDALIVQGNVIHSNGVLFQNIFRDSILLI